MRKWRNGFTIIEVLLTTVIIALGFIAASAFFYTNRKNLYNARIERYATWSAIEKIEEIKGMTAIAEEETVEHITLSEQNIPAERVVLITTSEDDELLWMVQVKVRWGQNNEVSLDTYIPK